MSSFLLSSKASSTSAVLVLLSVACATSTDSPESTTREVGATVSGSTSDALDRTDASSEDGRSSSRDERTSGSAERQDGTGIAEVTTTTDSPATQPGGDPQSGLDTSATSEATEAETVDGGESTEGGATRDAQAETSSSDSGAPVDATEDDNSTSQGCRRGESYYYPGCGVDPNPLEAGCYEPCEGASDQSCRKGTTCAVADVNPCVCNDLPPGAGCCAACGAQVWLCQTPTVR